MLENVGKCWKMLEMLEMLENVGKCWKILEMLENVGKMLENVGKMLENVGKCCRILWKVQKPVESEKTCGK